MTTSSWMDEVIQKNVVQLFPEFEMVDCGVATDGPTLTGLIGFSGAHLQGALGVMGSDDALERTAPKEVPFDPHDWVGELANRALGRIKIAMLRSGVEILASTPVVLRGISLSVVRGEQVRTFVLKHADQTIHLWVDYTPRGEVAPGDLKPIDEHEILEAGQALFF